MGENSHHISASLVPDTTVSELVRVKNLQFAQVHALCVHVYRRYKHE